MNPVTNLIKNNKTKKLLTLGFSLLCLATPARSQDDSSDNEIFDMKTLVVVANKSEVPLNQIGSTVDILDAYDLERTDQEFLLDSIRYVPGFYLRNNGGPGSTFGITVRGLNSNPPTVLIDGVEMDNPSDGRIINFGNLFGNNVSRVEILKGPQSSLYGANALAGVISIQTKDGRTDPGSEFALSYGAHNTFSSSLGTRGADGNFSWAFNASYYEREFSVQDRSFGPEWADEDRYENAQASAKLSYQISDDADVNLVMFWQNSFSEFDPGDPDSVWGAPESINFSKGRKLTTRLNSNFKVSDAWSSELAASYLNSNSASITGGRFASSGDRLNLEWNNSIEVQEDWTIIGGIEYEEETNRSDDGSRDNTSLFVENIFEASELLDITLGGRVDDNSAYGTETTGRASFSYRFAEEASRVRGSYGTSFQAPSFYQLFNPTYGDPGITPESGTGWDLGFEHAFADGKVFFSTTYFSNEVEDKIIFSSDTFKYANEGLYESRGLETALHVGLTQDLRATIAYTYTDANYRDGTEAERVPRNIYSVILDWEPLENFTVTTTALITSSQFSLRGSSPKQNGYTVVNIAANYKIDDSWEIWGRIDNLFDEDYQEILTYETSGFALYGGVKYSF